MPLNTPALKTALKAAFIANLSTPTSAQLAQIDTMCGSIALAMQVFVESATITSTTGLANSGGPVAGIFGNVIT